MTDKELKRLSRADLMQMIYDLTVENRALREKLADTEKKLADRTIALSEAGTLAEAALKLNGVFEAADAACRQYIENLRRLGGESHSETDTLCEAKETDEKVNHEKNGQDN